MLRGLKSTDFENGFSEILIEKFKTVISKEEFLFRLNETQTNYSGYFVLENDHAVIGYIKYILELKFSPDKKFVGHIEDLFIIKKFRNGGNGRKLLDYCLEFLKTKDCYKIILNCKPNLIDFYNKSDLNKVGELMEISLL